MKFDEFSEWVKTQPESVRKEFDDMSKKQHEIDWRETPVSQIYYGDKPICKNDIDAFIKNGVGLTDMQKRSGR